MPRLSLIRTLARPLLAAVLLTAPLALAGCDGGPAGSGSGIRGTYTLHIFNGSTMPVLLHQSGNQRLLLVNGSLELRAEGAFTEILHYHYADGGPGTSTAGTRRGTYTLEGSSLTFRVPESATVAAHSFTGTLQGREITYTRDHEMLTFVR